MNKVLNMMMPSLENHQMANLLGIDTVRKARGRGLLDAGLNMMALAGPRPATENINPAMIMKAGVDAGTQTYDNIINKELTNINTTSAIQDKIQQKESFNLMLNSDFISNEQKAFALQLGPEKGSEFLANVFLEKTKAGNKIPQTKKVQLLDGEGNKRLNPDGSDMLRHVPTAEILANPDLYQEPTELGTYGKNIRDFEMALKRPLTQEEKTEYINLAMQFGNKDISITQNEDGSVTFVQGKGGADMSKKTQGTLEGDILSADDALAQLNMIDATYEPEFYTIGGKFEAWMKNKFNTWDANKQDAWTQRKSVHDQYVLQYFNAYRKWVTGVASGEKEMAWIQRSIPSGKDSPMAFKSKLKSIKTYTEKAIARKKLALEKGLMVEPIGYNDKGMPIFDPSYKKFLNENPYREPIGSRLEYLRKLGYSNKQIANILIQEGYEVPESL